MKEKHVVAQIADAISDDDYLRVKSLIAANPEQVKFYTPFGGHTWIGYAAQVGSLNALRALIDSGLDLNDGDFREHSKPICCAAAGNHADVVAFLLNSGAILDVDKSVRNPLFAAIVGRSPEIVSQLLEAGIDGAVRYNSKTMKSMDAIAFALMRGEKECARRIAMWISSGDEERAKRLMIEADQIAELNVGGMLRE